MRGVLVTRPYYRSSYVFVTRPGTKISSLDDAALRKMKVGVQVLDDDYAPPARALSRRGLSSNVVGFDMDTPGAIIEAVANKKVDVAIVWGPTAGYFGRRFGSRVRITPVSPELDPPALPMAYDIAIGVRKSDRQLYEQVDAALAKATPAIRTILRNYNVPERPISAATASGGE
jgi:mxaJ protein